MLPDFENLELRAAVIDLRAHLATVKLERALHAYGDYLEGKYSPDQPRAPQGTPVGGQWIVDGGSARQQRLRERHLVAQTTPSGFVDPRTFQPANEDISLLGQIRARSLEAAARLLDFVVQRQQEDPQGLEDVLKLTQLLDPSGLILGRMLSADDKADLADLVENASEKLKPYLDEIATKLESGEINDETALLLTAGAIIAVAKYASKKVKTLAFEQIRPALRRITARLGLEQRKRELVPILVRRGTKITPTKVVDIRRLSDRRIVWLERGNQSGGLQHVREQHSTHFREKGVPEARVPSLIMEALEFGNVVGFSGTATVYQISYAGSVKHIAIVLGSNGFIVTAHPVNFWRLLP